MILVISQAPTVEHSDNFLKVGFEKATNSNYVKENKYHPIWSLPKGSNVAGAVVVAQS